MDLTPVQISFLQSVAVDAKSRQVSGAAEYFAVNYAIGVRVGRRYEYSVQDSERAVSMLRARNLPVEGGGALATDRAGAALRPGVSEKVGTTAPHANSVAFTLLGEPARQGLELLHPHPVGYAVATAEEVGAIQADLAVVVENLETFRQIRQYAWVMEALPREASVIVVFRGDPWLKVDDSMRALAHLQAPRWAFFDFDPAGLAMAAALDGLDRLLLPDRDSLHKAVKAGGRVDLWAQQYEQCWGALEACQHPDVARAWGWLKDWKKALPQEWMRDFG